MDTENLQELKVNFSQRSKESWTGLTVMEVNMAKRTSPIITHTEILARATNSIKREIDECRDRCKVFPKEQADTYFDVSTKELREKLDALKTLYRIETGADFE